MSNEDRIQKIKENLFPSRNSYELMTKLLNSDLDWLFEQAKENKKLKKRLALADTLIKKSKELTDLYQAQIERYEKALKEIAEYGGTDMLGKTCAKVAKESLS